MTDSDFQSITAGLCGPDGTLGPLEFEAVMRQQIKQATQTTLALVGDVRSPEDLEFMQFGALKMLLLEQVDFRAKGGLCNVNIGRHPCPTHSLAVMPRNSQKL